jgi:hypothetical protein
LFFIRQATRSVLMRRQDPWDILRVMHKPKLKEMSESRVEGTGAAL